MRSTPPYQPPPILAARQKPANRPAHPPKDPNPTPKQPPPRSHALGPQGLDYGYLSRVFTSSMAVSSGACGGQGGRKG